MHFKNALRGNMSMAYFLFNRIARTSGDSGTRSRLSKSFSQAATSRQSMQSGLSRQSSLNGSLFNFSRGRFVCNEDYEMAQRFVRYDCEALGTIAADAIGSPSCVNIEKLEDGMFNKAVLLTMSDGKQAVAKLPNPNSGPPRSTTASEVATMDFMRNTLGIPAPHVYAWCNNAQLTPVGAEYIIMEKIDGVPLESVFGTISIEDRFAITKKISSYQKIWASTSFESHGSLYYARDLPPDSHPLRYTDQMGVIKEDARFSVGPTTGRDWSDEGRLSIDFDRGPWSQADEYLKAIGEREIACVQQLSRLPKSLITLCGPGTYQPTREKKMKALRCYLGIIDLTTPSDGVLHRPCLWHSDLHSENIFVDPLNPTNITAIIDWQSTEIAPLFVQARQPHFVDHEGPQLPGTERPRLPSNYERLPMTEQAGLRSLFYQQSLRALYRTFMQTRAPDIWKAFEFQELPSYDLILLARNLLVDGEATYMAHLAELCESDPANWSMDQTNNIDAWKRMLHSTEKAEIMADAEGALRGMNAMQSLRNSMGDLFPERGMVRPEQYELTKVALRELKQEVIDTFACTEEERTAWADSWPFDD